MPPLPPPAPPAKSQLFILKTPSCLPQRFIRESDKMRTFLVQCEVFIGIRSRELLTGRSRVSFILSLLINSTVRWVLLFIENHDPFLDNFPNFHTRFREHFEHPVQMDTAEQRICQLRQSNSSVRGYIEDFKLLAADFDWNKPALRAQFKGSLNKAIITLIQQGTPFNLRNLCLAIAHLVEVKAFLAAQASSFQSCLLP